MEADAALQKLVLANGEKGFQAELTKGQYTRPNGLFYGGRAASWSNRVLRQILNDNVPETVKRLAVLHIHTGFGKAGFGEPIYVGPEKDGYETAKKWYGQEVSAMRSTLMSPVGGGVWAINGFRNSGKSCARRDLSATAMPQALLGDVAQS